MNALLKFADDIEVKDGVITAILSTEAVDRDGDIVSLDGWDLTNFNRAPRLMSCHDYGSLTKQIGEWKNVHVDPQRKALVGEAHYYVGKGNPEADWAYELAKLGQATYSVGFAPIDSEPIKSSRGSRYTRQELLECSHVPIPANQEALQLMAKALQSRHEPEPKQRQPGRMVRKWDSAYMGDSDDYGPMEQHCIVPGCDDASQIYTPICAEHLKVLMNADAEPAGGEADEAIEQMMLSVVRAFGRRVKAGRTISASNMGRVHSILDAAHALHDGTCTESDCEYGAGDTGSKGKAAGEGSGSAGGALVHPFDGTHTHSHATGGDQGADDTHSHAHVHHDDGSHTNAAHIAAHKALSDAETKAPESTASQNDLPDSAFAVVSSGGTKEDGKTTPRSLRHLPHHKADGSIDLPHLRNALARVSQTDISAEDKAKAEKHLEAHAKQEGIGDAADDKKGFDLDAALDEVLAKVEW